jgi:hypothetical protein
MRPESKRVPEPHKIAPGIARVTLLFNPSAATFVESYLNPFNTAVASLAWSRLLHLLTTCLGSNHSLRFRHASQVVVWSSYQMLSQSSIARTLFR